MELGGFEPPTSWVRFNRVRSWRQLQKSVISRELAGSRDRLACQRFAADTQGYAAICRESGTPGEKCPKFAQAIGDDGRPPMSQKNIAILYLCLTFSFQTRTPTT